MKNLNNLFETEKVKDNFNEYEPSHKGIILIKCTQLQIV